MFAGALATVLGATREPWLRRLVAGELPEAVAQEAISMVIMVRRNLPGRSRVRRWLRRRA